MPRESQLHGDCDELQFGKMNRKKRQMDCWAIGNSCCLMSLLVSHWFTKSGAAFTLVAEQFTKQLRCL